MIKGAFKQRMVGAIFILSLGVILIPVILDTPDEDSSFHYSDKPETPSLPEVSDVSKIHYVFNEIEQDLHLETEVKPVEPAPSIEQPKVPVQIVKAPEQPAPKRVVKVEPGDWTIQLGAFSSSENANVLLQRLSQGGFETYLKKTPGKKLVRVFVAPGVQREKAEALLSKLDSQYGIKGILVRYQGNE